MTGRITRDGCAASTWTVLWAITVWVWRPTGSPVLGFTSKRGKLELAMSRRIRWPRANRLLIAPPFIHGRRCCVATKLHFFYLAVSRHS